MRITFLTPHDSFNGGIRVVSIYARLLESRGHEVLVVSNPRRRPGLREQVRALRRGRWRELQDKTRPQAGHLANSGMPLRTLETSRPIRASDVPDADVVVATWWETALWMADFPASKGAKVHLIQGYETWADPVRTAQVDAALRLDNLKIAISNGLKRDIESRLGDLDIRVIPNAVDLKQFDAPGRSRQCLPRVGFVYAQNPIKGADRCHRIVERVRDRVPGLRVLAFGAEPPSQAMPLPQGTEFHLRPAQEDLAKLYARCDVWLFVSRVDSFGLPVLEAMASGTPVVGLPVGAAPELLGDDAGLLVHADGDLVAGRVDDPAAESNLVADIAEAVVELLGKPDSSWEAMSQTAYRRARGYSWDDAVDRFEAIVGETQAIAGMRHRVASG